MLDQAVPVHTERLVLTPLLLQLRLLSRSLFNLVQLIAVVEILRIWHKVLLDS